MAWFRSAALTVVILAIFVAAAWLFWGKEIERAWQKFRANPVVREKLPREKKVKEIAKKRLPEKTSTMTKLIPEKSAAKLPVNAADEWQKTQSGFLALVGMQKQESLQNVQMLADQNEARFHGILTQLGLRRAPVPVVTPPAVAAPTAVAPTTKPAARRRSTPSAK